VLRRFYRTIEWMPRAGVVRGVLCGWSRVKAEFLCGGSAHRGPPHPRHPTGTPLPHEPSSRAAVASLPTANTRIALLVPVRGQVVGTVLSAEGAIARDLSGVFGTVGSTGVRLIRTRPLSAWLVHQPGESSMEHYVKRSHPVCVHLVAS
jgi:hypothetical protein